MQWSSTWRDEGRRVSEILLVCNTGRTFISSVTSPNFHTNTMSLRSVLRLSSTLFHGLPSRNREGFLEDARNGLSFRQGIDSLPRHLHRLRLIFLLDCSFAAHTVVSWDPLSLCRHNRNQLEFVITVRHVEWPHVELDNHQRSIHVENCISCNIAFTISLVLLILFARTE